MAPIFTIPVLGRISLLDYIRLSCAFLFLLAEPLARVIAALLPLKTCYWLIYTIPTSAIGFLRSRWRTEFYSPVKIPSPRMSGEAGEGLEDEKTFDPHAGISLPDSGQVVDEAEEEGGIDQLSEVDRIANELKGLHTTEEFIRYWKFPFECHYVTTKDGYILALHRIPANPSARKAIDYRKSLAFTLAEAGYDVWLGNTRGNKYSCKHERHKPDQDAFWDFSLDELALYDLPNSVDYILHATSSPSISYIGFSQGSALGFAALSLNHHLQKKINLFIAFAPATKPKPLRNQTIHSLINASPEIIYLLFGRRALLSSVIFWQTMFPGDLFAWIIDHANWLLFEWHARHIQHKANVYASLYSYTGVKTVVHWFQIIRMGRFQMYDDVPNIFPSSNSSSGSSGGGGHVIPAFPTKQITTPWAVFWGEEDSLSDIDYILSKSPDPVYRLAIREFEHLDFLWGKNLEKLAYPAVLGLLSKYSESWSDASPILSADSLRSDSSSSSIRSAPWISRRDMVAALDRNGMTVSAESDEDLEKQD